MKEYSKRLGQISNGQFQAALARFNLGDLVRADPVPFGLFGQNVFLTSTRGEFVLRGAPHYPWQFPTERFFTERLHAGTRVPVPYPYLLEHSTDILGWSFAIMPRLPGLQLTDEQVVAQLTPADRLEIARAMARMLVEVHSLAWDCAGEYDPATDRIRPFAGGYGERVSERIRQNLAAARSHNEHTTGADMRWAEEIIARATGAFPPPGKASIVLGDYGEHNALVERDEDGWRVSAVFDLMTAHVGDGGADLCVPVFTYLKSPALADAFVDEYLRHKTPQPGFAERQELYTLDLMASMWEYWQRSRGGVPEGKGDGTCLAAWAGPVVGYWRRFR